MHFVNLHGHSSFSTQDGHGLPQHHVKRAKELGMKALALTEHGTVSSHVQLEKAALKEGIKPIFGVEAYVSPPKIKRKFHQTILAMNAEGYRSLSRLVTRSYENHHYFPTVDPEWLLDPDQTEGLIVMSGCADSWLSCTLAGGKSLGEALTEEEIANLSDEDLAERREEALALVKRFKRVYGDRYYLEVQPFHNYFRTVFLNQQIAWLSEQSGVPLVGTADVHYPHKGDWEVQRLVNAMGWGTTVETLAKQRDYEASPCTFPESDREYASWLIKTGLDKAKVKEAIVNSGKIADRCNVSLPKTPPVRYSESDGTDEMAQWLLKKAIADGIRFRSETNENFKARFENNKKDYAKRIRKELDTILPKGFSDYFLINQEIIGWAKDNGIAVGPGRGSAASSLICYLLRLTEIDPMEYPMMVFERFLDPSRDDDPDIDTDYADERRNEVFEFARSVYGNDHVGNIANFSRYRGRSATEGVAKAMNVPSWVVSDFNDLIADTPFGDPREFDTVEDTEEAFPEAKEIMEKYPELRLARRVEGDMRTLGIHAAGMVISNRPISETCAIYKKTKTNGDETEVIAYDKRDAAYLKMLKLDCLGLKTMQIISDVLDMVPDLSLNDLYSLPFDDEKVLKGFADDNLTGIFQFEGRTTRGIVKDIFEGTDKIPDFMTLADINALSRPGSLISGMTGRYVKVERGDKPKKIHPVVDAILGGTNGCLVYQEQVMKIGRDFGGLADSEIGRLRKIIGAKEMGGAFEAFWIKFRDGAVREHGVSERLAREVWDYMAASASYLFNVSHSISYAAVAYWCMYLKTYYPAEFYAASLRSAAKRGKTKGKADPQLLLLQDAVVSGLTVSPPNPASSGVTWAPSPDRTGVVAGFTQIPGVGAKVAKGLMETKKRLEERADANPHEWAGLLTWDSYVKETPGFGPKAAQKAEDMAREPDPFDINLTNSAISTIIDLIEQGNAPLDMPNATSDTIPDQDGEEVVYLGHVVAVKLIDVIGEMRSRENLSTEEVLAKLDRPELATKAKIICSDARSAEVHVNVSRYEFPRLRDEIAEIKPDEIFCVLAEGKAANYTGPSVQARSITAIRLEE